MNSEEFSKIPKSQKQKGTPGLTPTRFRRHMRMQREIEKWLKEHYSYSNMLIRNYEDASCPRWDPSKPILSDFASCFSVDYYCSYDQGISVYLDKDEPLKIIVEISGKWKLTEEIKSNSDNLGNSTLYDGCKVGNLPMKNIVYLELPDIYCKFDRENGPFESFNYVIFRKGEPFQLNDELMLT